MRPCAVASPGVQAAGLLGGLSGLAAGGSRTPRASGRRGGERGGAELVETASIGEMEGEERKEEADGVGVFLSIRKY